MNIVYGNCLSGARPGGFTLVEVLVTIAITAVLVSLAAPGLLDMIDKRRIEGPAEALYADMQFAKSEALKRGRAVRIVFKRSMDGSTWCYGMTHAATCDCMAGDMDAAFCFLDIDGDGIYTSSMEPIRANSNLNWPDVGLINQPYSGNGGTLTFNPPYATANAGNAEFQSERGKVIRIITAGIGRIRICSPAGSGKMWAYKPCA